PTSAPSRTAQAEPRSPRDHRHPAAPNPSYNYLIGRRTRPVIFATLRWGSTAVQQFVMFAGLRFRYGRAVIGRDFADWFRKHVAGKLTGRVIPDTAGAVENPIRHAGGSAKEAAETVSDQDLAGGRQTEQSGFGTGERPGSAVATDRASSGGDHSHAGPGDSPGQPAAPAPPPAEKYTSDSRRA